jgi:hypothetical protein
MLETILIRLGAMPVKTNLRISCEPVRHILSIGELMSTTTPAADTRFLRRVLVFLVVATLASGAMMAYAAASMS